MATLRIELRDRCGDLQSMMGGGGQGRRKNQEDWAGSPWAEPWWGTLSGAGSPSWGQSWPMVPSR